MNLDEQLELSVLLEDVPPPGDKRVAVAIGRFNPPTKGHYKLIDTVKKFIRERKDLNLQASPAVVVIGGGKSDQDKQRNPLSVDERIYYMQNSGNANGVTFRSAKNAFEAFAQLRTSGLEPIAIAAGSDRAEDYLRMLDQYWKDEKGRPIKHYKIDLPRADSAVKDKGGDKVQQMDSILAALKDGDGVGIEHVSGSLARRAAELGYFEEFVKITGLEKNVAVAKSLYKKVRAAIGSKE
jgi:hypothetical protein